MGEFSSYFKHDMFCFAGNSQRLVRHSHTVKSFAPNHHCALRGSQQNLAVNTRRVQILF